MPKKTDESESPVKVESDANTPTQLLRNALFRFRFDSESTPSLRRSPRHISTTKVEEGESELPSLPSPGRKAKKRSASAAAGPDVKKARLDGEGRKLPRGKVSVAPPEKYAHLNSLNDHLGEEPDMLDVMFCGINPGKMSATIGHHFAHPTNHFWKCLHGAELTDRLLDASEDGILPDSYKLGLTNLVSRPSSQAAELANTEYTDGVPALLAKIVSRRPRVVCFVGKQIWESFIKAAAPRVDSRKQMTSSESTPSGVTAETHVEELSVSIEGEGSTTRVTTTRKKSVKKRAAPAKQDLVFDLQPYKVVHSDPGARIRETLFFVVVSTSGLVAGYQRPEKIKQFTLLKQRVDELKAGSVDTSDMTAIPIPPDLL